MYKNINNSNVLESYTYIANSVILSYPPNNLELRLMILISEIISGLIYLVYIQVYLKHRVNFSFFGLQNIISSNLVLL